MIDALITGRLAADPKSGTSRTGNAYATARVLVPMNAEDRFSVSVIAFESRAIDSLLGMASGDAIALAGELTPKVWTDKDGKGRPSAHMNAHAVLTPYHVSRKRKAMQPDDG